MYVASNTPHIKILDSVSQLAHSGLDWYICWQIIISMLSQHPDFSHVPENGNETLCSTLDLTTAFDRLSVYGTFRNSESHDLVYPLDRVPKLDVLTLAALEAACRLLGSMNTIPRKGFLILAKSVISNPWPDLRYKAFVLVFMLQRLTDTFLEADTSGDHILTQTELTTALTSRTQTSGVLHPKLLLSESDHRNTRTAADENIVSQVKRRYTKPLPRLIPFEVAINAEDAHLAIVKLDNWVSRTTMTSAEKVRDYFRGPGLKPLLCPISDRPMTDAVYLRCGITARQSAISELLRGEIPLSHCCCNEMHQDMEHQLHDCPIISTIAIYHLSRVLTSGDLIRYGDLPTLQFILPSIEDQAQRIGLLRLAIDVRNTEIATLLVTHDTDLEQFVDGKTALMYTASLGLLDMVKILVTYGAPLSQRDSEGRNGLGHAASEDHDDVVEFLFSKMCSIPLKLALLPDADVPVRCQESCAEALHDLWLTYRDIRGRDDAVSYLRRAMELNPESHHYAEEMQEYLDQQKPDPLDRKYLSHVGSLLFRPGSRIDEDGNLYEGFMVNGVRTGPGKLTYSSKNEDLEYFDGEWKDDRKISGLLIYREF
jgi:Ankyrin repeats (3 copies)